MPCQTMWQINNELENPQPLPLTMLPTNLDVYNLLRLKTGPHPTKEISKFRRQVADKLIDFYEKVGIVAKDYRPIVRSLKDLVNKRNKLRGSKFLRKMWNQLFPVARCSCLSTSRSPCNQKKFFHHLTKEFLKDQSSDRRMTIDDYKATIAQAENDRQRIQEAFPEIEEPPDTDLMNASRPNTLNITNNTQNSDVTIQNENNDPPFDEESPEGSPHRNYNKFRMPETYMFCKRHGKSIVAAIGFVNIANSEMNNVSGHVYLSEYKLKNEDKLAKEAFETGAPKRIRNLQIDATVKLMKKFQDKSEKTNILVLSDLPGNRLVVSKEVPNQTGMTFANVILDV